MNAHTNLYEMDETVLARSGKYALREILLSWEKVNWLWATISKFHALFSDLTKGDAGNFMRLITEPNSIWLEIWDVEQVVGLIRFAHLEQVVDIDAHIIFLDRNLSDKVGICKEAVKWAFANLPIQRISVETPFYYYQTIRLVCDVGFTIEGERRKAVLIRGRWANMKLLGITRAEGAKI